MAERSMPLFSVSEEGCCATSRTEDAASTNQKRECIDFTNSKFQATNLTPAASTRVTLPVSSTLSVKGLAATARTPFWLWPNLLSLDAPLIAALWQELFAMDARVNLSAASRLALPLSVWLIYLVDRLLDTAGIQKPATARHGFYCAHRSLCFLLTGLAAVLLGATLFYLPIAVLRNGFVVSALVTIYLLGVHCLRGKRRYRFPKEEVVGLMFAVGSVLAPFTRTANGSRLLLPALLLGLLCWLNTSAIEVWEGGYVDGASAWSVKHMRTVAVITCMLCLPLWLWSGASGSALALFLTALGFWALADGHRNHIGSADALRVWIDVPLLAPLLLTRLR